MTTNALSDGDWIAVQTYCGYEKSVGEGLQKRNYEQFTPLHIGRRTRRGREEVIERAVFPGYVFCRFVRCPTYRIVDIPAVVRLVGISSGPIKIEDEAIENIRILVTSGVYSEPWRFIAPGETVLVAHGALRGARGVLVEAKMGTRLIISVAILGRAVAVEVNAADVVPLTTFEKRLALMERTRAAETRIEVGPRFAHL